MHIEDTVGLCSHSGNNRLYSHCDHLELWAVLDMENVPSVPSTAGRTYKYTSVKNNPWWGSFSWGHVNTCTRCPFCPFVPVRNISNIKVFSLLTEWPCAWLTLASLMAENGPLSPKRGFWCWEVEISVTRENVIMRRPHRNTVKVRSSHSELVSHIKMQCLKLAQCFD